MKGNFFIVGGGMLQVDFIQAVKRKGYKAYVFDYDPECPGKSIADEFHCVSIDDKEKILAIAREVKPVAIQTVATEMGNQTICYVGEKLGLNTNSYQVSLDTTDKSLMKKIFYDYKIPSSRTVVINDVENMPDFSFPFLVKASDRSAGRGIRLVNNKGEFKEAYADALSYSNNKIILAEEFFQGKQYSVETISFNGEHKIVAITEENVDGPPFFVEVMHLLPARINNDIYHKIEEVTVALLNACNIKYGASHIELLMNDGNEISIIELASRMGGYREKMIKYALDVDYLDMIIAVSTGQSITNVPLHEPGDSFSILKWIANAQDLEIYQKIKSTYPETIMEALIHTEMVNDTFQATNLMETAGYYIMKANTSLLSLLYQR